MPPDRPRLEALFLAHVPVIRRIVAALARRQGIDEPDRVDDLVAAVHEKLIADDYAVLARFRGDAQLSTYLTVVITMFLRDERIRDRGRWRPSAAALRKGAVAVRLERMVSRDRLPLDEAVRRLRASGETTLDDRVLRRLAAELPVRTARPRAIALDEVTAECVADDATVTDAVLTRDAHAHADARLQRALGTLAPDDQLLLRLRYWDGLTIADIARTLRTEQRPLYTRMQKLLAALRRALEADGVTRDEARALLEEGFDPAADAAPAATAGDPHAA